MLDGVSLTVIMLSSASSKEYLISSSVTNIVELISTYHVSSKETLDGGIKIILPMPLIVFQFYPF